MFQRILESVMGNSDGTIIAKRAACGSTAAVSRPCCSLCVYVCVCVRVRENERKRESESERRLKLYLI